MQRAESARDPLGLAWAAGLFEGEGTTYLMAAGGRRKHVDLRLTVKQARHPKERGVPMVLDRFQQAVGLGSICGPYADPGNRRPTYQWVAVGSTAHNVLAALWPYLGSVKREQAAAVFHRGGQSIGDKDGVA